MTILMIFFLNLKTIIQLFAVMSVFPAPVFDSS